MANRSALCAASPDRAGSCRFVFNKALAMQKENHAAGNKFIGYVTMAKKLGWLRYRNSRDVLGELRNVTVSQSGGKWFASIQTQREQRLARYQRRMSRKVKFSGNWQKAKARVQKIRTGIAHARKDFLHKTTNDDQPKPRARLY